LKKDNEAPNKRAHKQQEEKQAERGICQILWAIFKNEVLNNENS
jgi:hypothetical protein